MRNHLIIAICWFSYVASAILSSGGNKLLGVIVALTALLFQLYYHAIYASRSSAIVALKHVYGFYFTGGIVSIVLAWLGREMVAAWIMGLIIYSYACICLKHQALLYGGRLRLEENERVAKKADPLRYWLLMTIASTLGLLLLVVPLIALG